MDLNRQELLFALSALELWLNTYPTKENSTIKETYKKLLKAYKGKCENDKNI